jgi:hypothetical protein
MALSLKGLQGPDDFGLTDSSKIRLGGTTPQPVTWAVGDPVAFGLAGLAKADEKFAGKMDELAVNDFVLKTQKEFDARYNDPEKGEFYTRRGDASQGMLEEFQNTSRDNWEKNARETLTERQMQMAHGKMATLYHDWGNKVATFQAKETLNAKVNSVEDSIYQLTEMAATGDIQSLALSMGLIEDNVRALGDLQGWSPEHTEMKLAEARGQALIKGATALAATNPAQGLGMLNTYREMIPEVMRGPAEKVLRKHLETAEKRAKSAALTEYTNAVTSQLNGMDREDALYLIANDPVLAQHPKMQRTLYNNFNTALELQKKAADLQEKKALGNVQAEMRRMRDDGEIDPKKYQAVAMNLPPDKQSEVMAYSKRLLEGDTIQTDPTAFSELVRRIGRGDMFVSIDADYAGKLSLTDANTLSNPQRAKQLATIQPHFERAALPVMGSIKAEQAFLVFQHSIPPEGFKTPLEAQNAIAREMVRVAMDKNWAPELTVFGYEAADLAKQGYYPSAGPESVVFKARLAEQGYDFAKMSEEEKSKAYKLYRGVR